MIPQEFQISVSVKGGMDTINWKPTESDIAL